MSEKHDALTEQGKLQRDGGAGEPLTYVGRVQADGGRGKPLSNAGPVQRNEGESFDPANAPNNSVAKSLGYRESEVMPWARNKVASTPKALPNKVAQNAKEQAPCRTKQPRIVSPVPHEPAETPSTKEILDRHANAGRPLVESPAKTTPPPKIGQPRLEPTEEEMPVTEGPPQTSLRPRLRPQEAKQPDAIEQSRERGRNVEPPPVVEDSVPSDLDGETHESKGEAKKNTAEFGDHSVDAPAESHVSSGLVRRTRESDHEADWDDGFPTGEAAELEAAFPAGEGDNGPREDEDKCVGPEQHKAKVKLKIEDDEEDEKDEDIQAPVKPLTFEKRLKMKRLAKNIRLALETGAVPSDLSHLLSPHTTGQQALSELEDMADQLEREAEAGIHTTGQDMDQGPGGKDAPGFTDAPPIVRGAGPVGSGIEGHSLLTPHMQAQEASATRYQGKPSSTTARVDWGRGGGKK